MKSSLLTVNIILILGLLSACKQNHFQHHSVIEEKLKTQTWESPQELQPVTKFILNKGKVEVKDDKHGSFFTETRTDKLVQKNCLNCHKDGRIEVVGSKEPDSHWDIQKTFKHAQSHVMNCTTCHNPSEITQLKLLDGQKLSVDQSFKVCAQCHFKQEQDWRLGAHGKRIGSWYGERVIKNCASCHNPHKPAFEKRWPKTFNKNLNHFSDAAKK
jgi:hypothetical protein